MNFLQIASVVLRGDYRRSIVVSNEFLSAATCLDALAKIRASWSAGEHVLGRLIHSRSKTQLGWQRVRKSNIEVPPRVKVGISWSKDEASQATSLIFQPLEQDFVRLHQLFCFPTCHKVHGKSFGGRHVRFLLNIGRTDTEAKRSISPKASPVDPEAPY